jgi:ABC-2 type transport system permease protein
LRVYWELARRGYRRYAAYPGATAAGVFTNVFFGVLIAYVLRAVYETRAVVGGYDVVDAMTYVWLAQGLLAVVAIYGPSWAELALRVRSGDVAVDLYRPLDLQSAFLAQDAGRAWYQLVYRAVPPFLLGAVFFGVTVPDDAARWLAFAVSVGLAVLVSFGIRFLVNLSAFWLLDHRGVGILAVALTTLLCGMAVPLSFFPEPWDDVLRALPFAAIVQTPVDVFVANELGGSTALVLGLQALWAAVLVGLGHAALRAGTRRLVVQGG